ncbi:uncharacterized protein LOC143300123 [Babylonia areolata]|uniref:uncharacterized protein LOC143300123 n=1 Tax=Babylonia areolata TaxID=304850 RepID=UPI003FD5DB44
MADNSPAKTDSADEEDKDSETSNPVISKPGNDCAVKCDIDSNSEKEQRVNSTITKTQITPRSLPVTCDVDHGGDHINSQGANNSNGILSVISKADMGCSHSQGCMVSRHDGSQPNIAQSKPMDKVCSTHSRPGTGQYLNGLVTSYSHTSNTLSSQRNSLSASQGIASSSHLVHVNGNGAVFHDLSADDNFDHVMSNPNVCPVSSDQCHKGAKPKKFKRRPRRDDRHSKTGVFGKVPSDSDEDDSNFQNTVSKNVTNIVRYSQSASELRIGEHCNGDVPHSRVPELPPHLNRILHLNDRSDTHGAAALPVSPQRDEDLVDEGAVCDFDRNVLAGESLFYSENASISSPCDGANVDSSFPNGHISSYHMDHPLECYQGRERKRRRSLNGRYNASDSEDDMFRHVPDAAAVGPGGPANVNNVEDVEDNGDFIDTDLPVMSGPLMSSSADSASLSSVNGDMADAGTVSAPTAKDTSCSKQENDLSGGSDKELNHKQNSSPDLRRFSDSAMFRTSYSSPSHDGGFDNFLLPRDLSSSDGVFWNSSESENEDEISEGAPHELPAHSADIPGPMHEGAGVAEALVTPPHGDEHVEPQFGAGGDLVCFYFDRACCLQENQCPTTSCLPHAGQSASRHYAGLLTDMASEGEAGGACAPPPPVNNLNRLLPATSGLRGPGEAMANGLDDVAPSNFINDESNRQQKVFDKFPMVEEGREGAGSSSGQGKCDNDNVLFLASAPGILDRQGDRASLQDQDMLEPNVESCSTMGLPEYNYKSPFGESQPWRANSESGVSEPVVFEDRTYGYRLYPSSDCCVAHNSLHHSLPLCKTNKDNKKKRIVCRPIENGVDSLPSVERMMIWSEYEAYLLQVKQIGMSACGQTAVLNLLKAFEIMAEKEDVCSTIQVNLRKEKASVAEYLASRAVAGTTAEELLSGVERLTKGEIRGRFFQLWPPRSINLLSWLSQWMKRGAVPVATLNLQKGAKQQQIPDAWHHQMVYGVGPRGVYLTNPLEIVPEERMMEQLTSDSVLLVRRQDVVSRFQPTASLARLLHHPDPRWCRMNVLGQVVNILREHNMPSVPGYRAQVTSHIRIPAVYRAGVTLYVRHNTAQWTALRSAPDLPLLSPSSPHSDSSSSHPSQ